jgi:hypothetical protein
MGQSLPEVPQKKNFVPYLVANLLDPLNALLLGAARHKLGNVAPAVRVAGGHLLDGSLKRSLLLGCPLAVLVGLRRGRSGGGVSRAMRRVPAVHIHTGPVELRIAYLLVLRFAQFLERLKNTVGEILLVLVRSELVDPSRRREMNEN